jgi:lipopolysaccharide/colanic/teichoic acid biosynthesis glycosyltransferase
MHIMNNELRPTIMDDLRFAPLAQVSLNRSMYPLVKRVFDCAVCIAVLPLAVIMIAMIACAIYFDSPGPVFFVQERVGQNGRRFRMIKFRTLGRDHDQLGSREFMKAFVSGQLEQHDNGEGIFKPVKKSEITRVGRLLRRTSLDELPQIVNVLRGEMSLVGPRPNVPWEVEAYQEWHKERLRVLPGITGLAQVRGRSGISFDSIVKYDIQYVTQQSLQLDLQILWWTLSSVMSGRGAG